MTNSGSSTGAYDGGDNLPPINYQLFAGIVIVPCIAAWNQMGSLYSKMAPPSFSDYLTATVRYFETNWSIPFVSVAPFSEPTANWWVYSSTGSTQEVSCHGKSDAFLYRSALASEVREQGCHFDMSSVQAFLNVMNKSLKAANMHIDLAAPDEVAYSTSQSDLQQMNLSLFTKINTHGYFDPPLSERQSFGQVAAATGKKVWMSELGTGGQTMVPASPGIRELGGIGLARQIMADINFIGPAAWIYWQVIHRSPIVNCP
jgi:hypothetical protein